MADRVFGHNWQDTTTTTSSTSWVAVGSTYSYTPPSTGDYIIIAMLDLDVLSTSAEANAELRVNGTAIHSQETQFESQVSFNISRPIVELYKYTASNTNAVTIQWYVHRSGTSANVVAAQPKYFVMKMAGNDSFHTLSDTSTSSSTYTSLGTQTFPASGDFVVLTTMKVSTGGSADRSAYALWEKNISSTGTQLGPESEAEMESYQDNYWNTPIFGYAENVTTSDYIELFGKVDGGTNSYYDIDVVFLDAAEFTAVTHAERTTTFQTTSTNSLTTAHTLTDPASGEDVLLLGSWSAENVNSNNFNGFTRAVYGTDTDQAVTIYRPGASQEASLLTPFVQLQYRTNSGSDTPFAVRLYSSGGGLFATGPYLELLSLQLTATTNQTLTVSSFNPTITFYSPNINQYLQVNSLSVSPSFYALNVASESLQPSTLTVSPTFYVPTVTVAPLEANKLTVTPTFYNPAVETIVSLQPSLLDGNAGVTFYNPQIAFEALTANTLTTTVSFYSPKVSVTVAATNLAVTPTFYAPTATFEDLTANLLTVTPTFYIPQVTVEPLNVSSLTVTPQFYSPTFSRTINVSVFNTSVSFYPVALARAADVNQIAVTPSFYTPTVTFSALLVNVFAASISFYQASIGQRDPNEHQIVSTGAIKANWISNQPVFNWVVDTVEKEWIANDVLKQWEHKPVRSN